MCLFKGPVPMPRRKRRVKQALNETDANQSPSDSRHETSLSATLANSVTSLSMSEKQHGLSKTMPDVQLSKASNEVDTANR